MSINIESTTDTPEQVQEAVGNLKETTEEVAQDKEVVNEKPAEESAPPEEASETIEEESETSEEEESEQAAKAKSPKGVRNRIKKLGRKLSEKDQEIEFLREQLRATTVAKPPQETVKADNKPDPDNFDTQEEYLEAIIEWKAEKIADKKLESFQSKVKEENQKTEFQKTQEAHFKRVEDFQAKTADFEEVIESIDDILLSLTIQEVILHSDNGPELMYELGKHREELERINSLSPIAAARELGKFEAKVFAKSDSKKIESKTTKAPAPIKPVSKKTSGAVKSIYDPDLSFHEYEKLREQQLRKI